jgi:hypothetical protein
MEPPSPTNLEKEEETIMQETSDIEGSQEEMEEEEEPQEHGVGGIRSRSQSPHQAHGEKEINKM